MKNSKSFGNKSMVPVYFPNGTKGKIDINSIPMDQWTHYHGKAINGTQVNSLLATEIGDSTILMTKGRVALSVRTADLEVFAAQFAENRGYSVQQPAKKAS